MRRALTLLLALAACTEDPPGECTPGCPSGQTCTMGQCVPAAGADAGLPGVDGGGGDDAGLPPRLTALELDPPQARLSSVNGSRPTQPYRVMGAFSDGSRREVTQALLTVEPLTLGSFDAQQLFTASGRVGGDGVVSASLGGVRGQAPIRVELEEVIFVPPTSTGAEDLFDVTPVDDPVREAGVVYPLDGVVMPQNVPAAEIQWTRGVEGDVFRVRMEKPAVRVTAYVTNTSAGAPFRDAWLVDQGAWRRIAQSEPLAQALLTVDRWEAASAAVIRGAPLRMGFAPAALLGSIYYWDIVAGRIQRINDGTATRDAFMPSPPLGCVGCHSVAQSGRYMAGRFGGGDNVGSVFDLTVDLSGPAPPTIFPVQDNIRWWFSTWSPDDLRMMVTKEEGGVGRLALLDPLTGAELPAEGVPGERATHPAWSPDGAAVAYVANNDAWGGANTTGDLKLLPVLGGDRFGAPNLLVRGSSVAGEPAGQAASYPTWSPDSGWLAFAHGNSSRSEVGASALYLVRKDGTNLVRLDRASGGPLAAHSFQPRFSPFHQGGHFWMSFLSRRDYGNAKAGTLGTARQQIWVSAVKDNPAAGEDPSAVPYWLPGQDTASLNISAYWAPRACRPIDDPCGVGAECCTGECSGNGTCQTLSACRPIGQTCTANDQCCDGILCIDGSCGSL